jgi:hypothetical protein
MASGLQPLTITHIVGNERQTQYITRRNNITFLEAMISNGWTNIESRPPGEPHITIQLGGDQAV